MANFPGLRYLFFLLLVIALPASADAEIFVNDAVALSREEILIKAETKSGYFAKGGKIVEFFVNGKSIGSVLSGGDSIAYKTFKTGRPGMYTVLARSGKDIGSGVILVLKKGSALVFIDIEGSLLATPFAKKPVKSSREVIRRIMNSYPVVYLHTGNIGISAVREWLRQNRFPVSAVMSWQMGDIFAALNKKGLKIKAVIGSQTVIDSANEYKPEFFGFNEEDSSKNLKTWQDIEKKLR
jgi:hypothetical protein